MCNYANAKSVICELTGNSPTGFGDLFILSLKWTGHTPKAGQFFMVKPLRSSVFLARPFSIFEYIPQDESGGEVKFLIAKRGKGTDELAHLCAGAQCELTGPLGNAWEDFLPPNEKTALIGGGVGIAPLASLVAEKPDYNFSFFAGFKTGFYDKEHETKTLGAAVKAKKIVITSEDSWTPIKGIITDFFDEKDGYNAVFACGPVGMLKAIKEKCEKAGLPCYLSLEKRMACGVGACLGCTARTVKGNRRCCADGPIFASQELIFDE